MESKILHAGVTCILLCEFPEGILTAELKFINAKYREKHLHKLFSTGTCREVL